METGALLVHLLSKLDNDSVTERQLLIQPASPKVSATFTSFQVEYTYGSELYKYAFWRTFYGIFEAQLRNNPFSVLPAVIHISLLWFTIFCRLCLSFFLSSVLFKLCHTDSCLSHCLIFSFNSHSVHTPLSPLSSFVC